MPFTSQPLGILKDGVLCVNWEPYVLTICDTSPDHVSMLTVI
jgi:hypothetical protein